MDRRLDLLSNGTVVNGNEPNIASDIVARSPVDDGNGDEMDVAHEEVERSAKGPVDDGNGDEPPPPPTAGAARRFVSMATRTQGVRNRIGLTLDGDSWPQQGRREASFPHANLLHPESVVDEEEKKVDDNWDEDYALIHRVDYTTYTLLHASVYTYIGNFVTLIVTHLMADTSPPLESTLMLAGVVLHAVTIYFMSVLAYSFSKHSLHYTLTIVVIVLMAVMTLLMLLDCVLMWMLEGKRKTKKKMRKPPRKRIT